MVCNHLLSGIRSVSKRIISIISPCNNHLRDVRISAVFCTAKIVADRIQTKRLCCRGLTFVGNFWPRITFGDVQRRFTSAALDISISTSISPALCSPMYFSVCSVLRKLELKAVNESNKFHGFGNVETAIRVRAASDRGERD